MVVLSYSTSNAAMRLKYATEYVRFLPGTATYIFVFSWVNVSLYDLVPQDQLSRNQIFTWSTPTRSTLDRLWNSCIECLRFHKKNNHQNLCTHGDEIFDSRGGKALHYEGYVYTNWTLNTSLWRLCIHKLDSKHILCLKSSLHNDEGPFHLYHQRFIPRHKWSFNL